MFEGNSFKSILQYSSWSSLNRQGCWSMLMIMVMILLEHQAVCLEGRS